jgi:hypothetical protein
VTLTFDWEGGESDFTAASEAWIPASTPSKELAPADSADFIKPLLHEPDSCPGLPIQHAIIAGCVNASASGTVASRNDAARTAATNPRATASEDNRRCEVIFTSKSPNEDLWWGRA